MGKVFVAFLVPLAVLAGVVFAFTHLPAGKDSGKYSVKATLAAFADYGVKLAPEWPGGPPAAVQGDGLPEANTWEPTSQRFDFSVFIFDTNSAAVTYEDQFCGGILFRARRENVFVCGDFDARRYKTLVAKVFDRLAPSSTRT